MLDLDGTLADSLSALRAIYHAFLADHGVRGSEAEFQRLNGPPLRRIVEALKSAHGLTGETEALYRDYLSRLEEAHHLTEPASGAEGILRRAKSAGWQVAVVTSTPRMAAQAWLHRVGLAPYVDEVVGGDDVGRGKPAPEPYELALKRCGCAAEHSLAVEDSLQGALSATTAGLPLWFLGPAPPGAVAGHPLLRGCLAGFAELAWVLEERG